jgi:hypothetical protein
MSLMEREELTGIRVDLPNHWATGGESMWARPLGNDTYELRNTPFYAYGLNFLDVVEACAETPDRKPTVIRVTKRSGHRTLRVRLSDAVPVRERRALLDSLVTYGASFEGRDDSFFAIDIAPTGDYRAVCERLAALERAGVLDYETCEARVADSFDDVPPEPGTGAD